MDLLQSILELQNAIISGKNEMVYSTMHLIFGENEDPITKSLLLSNQVIDPMLLTTNMAKKPTW